MIIIAVLRAGQQEKRNRPPKILATQNGAGRTLWPYQSEKPLLKVKCHS
jgi:hypothetical protein